MSVKYPFKNLAFQGGGVKTLAYQGALRVLAERKILAQIERVVGTSAGAFVAMLVAFRLPVEETVALFNAMDFSQVPATRTTKELTWQPPKMLEPSLERIVGNLEGVQRLIYKYGWYANERGYTWLQDMIGQQCGGNGRATFAEFKERGYRDLYVAVTNISTRRLEVFCVENTPDVAVADALLMSQSIPLFFEAVQFDGEKIGEEGHFYGDGGVLNNFPIHVFDRKEFAIENEWYVNGVNWETLGLRLYTPYNCPGANRPITNLLGYMSNLLEAMVESQDAVFESSQVDKWRTINISNCCVALTDFSVRPHPDNEKFQKLLAAGQQAAEEFLTDYRPPTPDQLAKLKRILGSLWPALMQR